ncbi:MAG: hypothetical protein ACFCUU_17660 [Cyclobacteriaceae bacterium]
MRTIFYSITLATFVFACSSEENVSVEKNGSVVVEAEDFFNQSNDDVRAWHIISASDSSALEGTAFSSRHHNASGNAYIMILPDTRITHDDELVPGENYTEEAGTIAVVSYKVKFNTPGKYYVWVRAFSTGTEDNGVHVGINDTWPDSGRRMQWHDGKFEWTWESKQRTQEVHSGVPEQIYLEVPKPGIHVISFSMREDGFAMDKWAMTQKYEKPVD